MLSLAAETPRNGKKSFHGTPFGRNSAAEKLRGIRPALNIFGGLGRVLRLAYIPKDRFACSKPVLRCIRCTMDFSLLVTRRWKNLKVSRILIQFL